MMVSVEEGTVATYPSKQTGLYVVQFTLRGGRSYSFCRALKKAEAEEKACQVALSHPQWKDLELNPNWNVR